jgi:hypothetical protein|tara:strand:- start:4557 stop:5015 length:459 start_codon:yes stop_codon:yes gene_type:complete
VVKIPIKFPPELLAAMGGGSSVATILPTTKTKILFVDGEMYGSLEFPRSFNLGRGQLLKLAGYGELQVLEATIDTLTCTKEISKELNDEYRRNPPDPDPVPEPIVPVTGGRSSCGTRPVSGVNCEVPTGKRTETGHPTLGDAESRATPSRFL